MHDIWEQTKQHENRTRPSSIGETRWCSKDTCVLKKTFGLLSNSNSAIKPLYVRLIITLETIQQNFNPDVRAKAKVYLESFCQYETVITAETFLRIFGMTKPLSK